MSKKIDDISVESILNGLFSQESDDNDSSTVVKVEEIDEITDDEKDILEGPIEADDGADGAEVAEESARIFGDVQLLQFGMRAAEEYVWTQSTEAVDIGAALKKFWSWLKSIVIKIREYALSAIRYANIFLAGDMKGIVKWYAENKAKVAEGLTAKGGDISLVVKKPVAKFPSTGDAMAAISAIVKAVQAQEMADEANVKTVKDFIATVKVPQLNATVFGKDAKSADVSMKDYNDALKALGSSIDAVLTSASWIKTSATDLAKYSRETNASVNVINKAANIAVTDENKSKVEAAKAMATLMQQGLSATVSAEYWILSTKITMIKICRNYAKKAVAAAAKPEKKEPAKEEKK